MSKLFEIRLINLKSNNFLNKYLDFNKYTYSEIIVKYLKSL